MYAVIETGGKQYRVQEGDVITIEKLNVTAGDDIAFDKVLLMSDGETVQVGSPVVEAAKVYGTVVENGKGEKVIIFKYKSKKDYRKKQGHRQPYTMVKIESLSADGKPAAKKVVEKPAVEVTTADAEVKAPAKKKTTTKKATEGTDEKAKKPAAKKTTKVAKEAEAKDAE